MVALLLLALQDAVEIKTNDGATPRVRLSLTTGTTADVWVKRSRFQFATGVDAGFLNVATDLPGTPVAGDLRFDGTNLLFYTTSWQTVTTTSANLWQDAGTYVNALGNSNARVYDSGQRYMLWGTQAGTTAGTSWYSDSYAGLFGENSNSADNQSYHAGVIGAVRNNPVASLANAGVVGLRHDGAGGVPTWGALAIKTAAGEMAAVYGSTTHVATAVYGVYGSAAGAATTNYGVYGTASGGATNWAGYFSGNANVTANLYFSTNATGIYFAGSSMGGDATRLYTSADRLFVRAEDVDNVAQFASYGLYLPQDPGICFYAGGDIRLGYASATDNDTIYFDAGDKTLMWNEASARFDFSNTVYTAADVIVNGNYRNTSTTMFQGGAVTDWLRIYGNNFTNGAAIYRNIATDGGLSVGAWTLQSAGNGYFTTSIGVGVSPNGADRVYSVVNAAGSFAVRGDNDNAGGTGVYGNGEGSGFTYFVDGAGVQGFGDQWGVMGRGQTGGVGGGGFFDNFTGSPYTFVAYYNGTTNYTVLGDGVKSTIVKDTRGNRVALYCPEAPEVLFQDFGIADLAGGRIRVKLDPILAKNIFVDAAHPLRVYLQPYGESKGVHVENATADGFDIVEDGGGRSAVKVAWMVTANRADDGRSKYATLRFGKAPGGCETRTP